MNVPQIRYACGVIDLGVGDVWAEITHDSGTVVVTDPEDQVAIALTADEIIGLADWLRERQIIEQERRNAQGGDS